MAVVAEAVDGVAIAVDAAVVADAAAVGIAATAVIAGNSFLLFFVHVPRSTGVRAFPQTAKSRSVVQTIPN
jgi:hypothetical protein